jgi:hypothetical protein
MCALPCNMHMYKLIVYGKILDEPTYHSYTYVCYMVVHTFISSFSVFLHTRRVLVHFVYIHMCGQQQNIPIEMQGKNHALQTTQGNKFSDS